MEVEENQPPQKKMKQATLSFFKGRKDDSVPLKQSEPQGRKRQNSSGSESPNKIAKLSKPLAVLTSTEAPNSKLVRQGIKFSSQDSSDQEVSSSSEADSTGNKADGKCLMDRFVKKLHNNSNQEISSTNDDVDSTETTVENKESVNDKENVFQEMKKDEECNVDSESDCFIVSTKAIDPSEHASDDATQTEANEQAAVVEDDMNECSKETSNKIGENTVVSDHEVVTGDNADGNKSIELDPNESFTTSLDKSEIDCTSTPVKPVPGLVDNATPKNTPSSSKKKGRKVDSAKKAVDSAKKTEKDALKQKQKEEREEQRLAKKKKLEEEKAEKERLRVEKQEAKEKAKQELKEKQAQEKIEKDKLKEEERLKKEEERKLKEEQRLKKQAELEAKQEEKKKKDEEKKLKDEEKQREEEEKKKKEQKVKMAFQSFFKTKENPQKSTPSKTSSGFFAPFHLKKDMHLAPTLRRDALCSEKKSYLDEILKPDQPSSSTYLQQLRNKDLRPKRTGRKLRKNPKPAEEMDIEVIHDSEALKKVSHKVKILKFHTDNRPPYFGTWRKETKLTPRNPYKKDEDVFDYEVDSDEEWEEEEPGESLSCSDGEEEKEDKEEEEEEDGWMVPHGYLSEDEGCNEDDDDISPEKLKLQQIAKAKAWDEEQKRKFHALPVVAVGCFFEHSPSVAMSGDVRLLYEFKGVVLEKAAPIPTALSTAFELPACDETQKEMTKATAGMRGYKKQSVPDEAMPDLIKLVHGSVHGIKRLIKEFRVFWNQNKASSSCLSESYEEDPDESLKDQPADMSMDTSMKEVSENPNKSQDANSSVSKPKEEGHGCEISKRQLDIKIMAIAVREKRPTLKKTAWFVHDSVLVEYGMTDIQLPNSWVFLTSVPTVSPVPKSSASSTPAPQPKEEDASVKKDDSSTPAKAALKDQRSIMDFTVTKEEMEELKQSQVGSVHKLTDYTVFPEQKPEITACIEQPTLKDKKSGQRSIMDFAKSAAKCNEKIDHSKAVSNALDVAMAVDCGQSSTASIIKSNEVGEKSEPVVDSTDVVVTESDNTKDSIESHKSLVTDKTDSKEAREYSKSIVDSIDVIMIEGDDTKDSIDINKSLVTDKTDSKEAQEYSKSIVDSTDVIMIESDDSKDAIETPKQ